jgi:DNA-binding transcriptional regulator LsrR (DeoR family)
VRSAVWERASRSYGPQSITQDDVARHLGITGEQVERAVALAVARRLILTDGSDPPHSMTLDQGLREG